MDSVLLSWSHMHIKSNTECMLSMTNATLHFLKVKFLIFS